MQANDPPRRLGFGVFEVDLRERQLTKRGLRIRLQEQPFQVLAMLLERPGEVVTRDELRSRSLTSRRSRRGSSKLNPQTVCS